MKEEIIKNPKGRLTCKKLVEWINKKFESLDITNYIVTDVKSTRYTSDQIEGGACRLHIFFSTKDNPDDEINKGQMMCFYSIKELQWYINNGYDLYFRIRERFGNRFLILSQLELDVKRKK